MPRGRRQPNGTLFSASEAWSASAPSGKGPARAGNCHPLPSPPFCKQNPQCGHLSAASDTPVGCGEAGREARGHPALLLGEAGSFQARPAAFPLKWAGCTSSQGVRSSHTPSESAQWHRDSRACRTPCWAPPDNPAQETPTSEAPAPRVGVGGTRDAGGGGWEHALILSRVHHFLLQLTFRKHPLRPRACASCRDTGPAEPHTVPTRHRQGQYRHRPHRVVSTKDRGPGDTSQRSYSAERRSDWDGDKKART